MNEKLDKLNENINKIILKSNDNDKDLEIRLKAIETELELQKQKRQDDHDSTMRRIAYWGVVITVITLLINVFFNLIK